MNIIFSPFGTNTFVEGKKWINFYSKTIKNDTHGTYRSMSDMPIWKEKKFSTETEKEEKKVKKGEVREKEKWKNKYLFHIILWWNIKTFPSRSMIDSAAFDAERILRKGRKIRGKGKWNLSRTIRKSICEINSIPMAHKRMNLIQAEVELGEFRYSCSVENWIKCRSRNGVENQYFSSLPLNTCRWLCVRFKSEPKLYI